jgi:hypothetical protein
MRVRIALSAFALAAVAVGCQDPPPPPDPAPIGRAVRGADDAVPPGFPPGTFFWRVVRGDRDKLDDYRVLRDDALRVLEEAARFPAKEGAQSPAAQLLGEVRATFDESTGPSELEARLAYFDRTEAPAAEGIALTLVRRATGAPERSLTLTLEDLATGGAVDGRIDRVRIAWCPRGEAAAGALSIELGEEGGEIVEHVLVADQAGYRVSAPQVAELFARVQREVYKPLSGQAFVRVARAAPGPLRFRPAPPQGTSFPAPEASIH